MLSLSALARCCPALGRLLFFRHGAKQQETVAENGFRQLFKIVLTALSGRMRMIAKLNTEAILWAQIRARARITEF